MKYLIRFIILLLFIQFIYSCGKDEFEPYDNPFIHIMKDEVSAATVSAKANVISTYNIFLSSKPLTETLVVEFSIVVGDGLVEGVDYEIVNSSNQVTFLPGIYDMPVRIRWKSNPINSDKDNSVRIRLENNSMNFSMGLPGESEMQREFTITKVN